MQIDGENVAAAGLPDAVREKYRSLQKWFAEAGNVAVAYSGGVDSVFALKVAHDVLGERCLAVIATSASMPRAEFEGAIETAKQIGAQCDVIESHELDDPRYCENGVARCYYCKGNVFDRITAHAKEKGFTIVVDGTNHDDKDDHRPGRRAAVERGVKSPLEELGITKQDIRDLSKELDLPTWDKPAAPCLSSRIPYGTRVTEEVLSMIERGEAAVRSLGIRELRVRHHNDLARIEVHPEDFATVLENREQLVRELKEIGYLRVSLDLKGFRSGSLNEGVV